MLFISDAIIYLILVGDIFSILLPKPFHFDEHPRLIYLHSQKQDNLDDDLHKIRNALEKTSYDCAYYSTRILSISISFS
jgi:hypothetical protein